MSTKETVYNYLVNHKNEYISGSKLAKELGVSRNAIWKAIKSLEMEGVSFSAVPNKGYMISENVELLTCEEVKKHIRNDRIRVEVFESVDSTNNRIKEKAQAGEDEGLLYIAKEQTKGRGRMNRKFSSPKGSGVYFSLLLRPNLPANKTLYITTIAAVSVAMAVEKITGKTSEIKWVNDVLINDKKVCGILTEGAISMENGNFDYAVVGIGINVREPEGGFPEEIKDIAGSVIEKDEDLPEFIRARIVAETINNFMDFYEKLPEKGFLEEYRKRFKMTGKDVYVIEGNHRGGISVDEIISEFGDSLKVVKVLGIDDDLGLIVEGNGKREVLRSGEVSIRRK